MGKKERTVRLFEYIKSGNLTAARECLSEEGGVYGGAKNPDGKTALHLFAIRHKYIVDSKLPPDKKEEAENSFLSLLQTLLAYTTSGTGAGDTGFDPNAECNFGMTPAHYLAYEGKEALSALRVLQQGGANLNTRDKEGRSILYWAGVHAKEENSFQFFTELLKMGVDGDPRTNPDKSDLFFLAKDGNLSRDLIRAAVEFYGRDILGARNSRGQNLLMVYCLSRMVRFGTVIRGEQEEELERRPIDYMLANGIDINDTDNAGESILTGVTEARANPGLLRYLVSRGADMYYAPNGWDTYIARSLRNNYFSWNWTALQDFVHFAGNNVNKGLSFPGEKDSFPHPLKLMKDNEMMGVVDRVTLSMLLLAMYYPKRDELLFTDAKGKNRGPALREIGATLSKEEREISPRLVKNLFAVFNSLPSMKNSMFRTSEDEFGGLLKLLVWGMEHCGSETVEFIQKHVGEKTLGKWMATAGTAGDELATKLATLLRSLDIAPPALKQRDISF